MSADLKDYPIQIQMPVVWGEMDAQGHLNNVYYFRHFENARARYFDLSGILEIGLNRGLAAVVAETSCRFKKSIQYPDILTIGAHMTSISEFSCHMNHLIFSEKQGVAAIGMVTMVLLDMMTGKKTKVPQEFIAACEKIEDRKLTLDIGGDR